MNHNTHNNRRGYYRGRGRGEPQRGGGRATPPAGPGRGVPRNPYPYPNADLDVVQQWAEPDASTSRNGNVNRVNGPWRGGTPKSRSGAGTPSRGVETPRRGNSTPRGVRGWGGRGGGRGRGRGLGRGLEPDISVDTFTSSRRPRPGVGGVTKLHTVIGKDASLTELLYSERPLLRPVKFVQATLTPFLFQQSEEVLKPAVDIDADTTETPHVSAADRIVRLFYENVYDSDSESEDHFQDALEEIDFADMAQIRAEVDAIAQGTTTIAQDDYDAQGIEEVDFADLGAIRAQVDAANPRPASRDDVLEEVFTGVYNRVKDTTRVTSAIDDAQRSASLSAPDTIAPEPSIEIANESSRESLTQTQDTIVIEEAPRSDESIDASAEEQSLPVINDLSPPPDTLDHDADRPRFIIDTTPTTHRSTSDAIPVDRTGHGETLGDEDEERIVYVAPHPRSGRASPFPSTTASAVPSVQLSHMSLLTGKHVEARGLTSPIREDDAEQEMTAPDIEAGEHTLSLAALGLGPDPTRSESPADPAQTDAKAARRARKKEARLQRKRQRQGKRVRAGFSAFGAMMSEARLREDAQEKQRPEWENRRRGDSDLDWGTDDEDEGDDKGDGKVGMEVDDEVDALSNDLGGMEIDDLDADAMHGFLKSMSAKGSKFVTMDDIEDEAQLQREDEEEGGPEGSSDSELDDDDQVDEAIEDDDEEAVFNLEEKILIAESEDDEDLSPDSDNELSPRSSFKARLRKVRERNSRSRPKAVQEISDDELSPRSSFKARPRKVRERNSRSGPKAVQEISDDEEDSAEILLSTKAAHDEEFFAHINDLLEENSEILAGRDRKQRKALFRHLHQGYVEECDPEFTPVNKKKGKGKAKQFEGVFASELEAQWAKDRAKKAVLKQERATARLLASLDPLSAPNGNGRGGTSRKAMRAAARLDPNAALAIAPRAIVDTSSLEAQIRRFAEAKVGARTSMALPPMDKGMRKLVHELAALLGIKSVSKGKGTGRYTTLFRTSWTGLGVKEEKVSAVMRRYGHRAGRSGEGGRGRGGKGGRMPRQREGEEVGKEAPKIGESNIGFRMLASMGWSEGDRIGGSASVGIEAPLTAVIKYSKLGLGATR